jgi:two-component system, sensor histidine kinase
MSRFLIVDDNEQNLYQLQVLLRGHGHETVSAKNGKEALDHARREPPDVIITDILMPMMDGFTLCRHWKADPHLQTIPLVFYTATYTDSKDEDLGISLGAARFLIKPIEPDAFMEIIGQVLQEAHSGRLPTIQGTLLEEPHYLKEYSEALIRKLEDKVTDLEVEIAKRKKVEAALLQAKDTAERASRVKSEFLSMISHELRTPLHVVLGYANLLLDNAFGELSAEQIDAISRLQRNGNILLDRISHVLDLRRLEDGRFPLELSTVHVPALIQQLDDELPELRTNPEVRYTYTIEADLPPIRSDPYKLKMIIRNVLSNALKFTEVGTVSLVASRTNDGVEICVTDTGIGIPTNALAEIFEPFYQVDSGDARRHGGIGLGLHIVKRVLGMLGGNITVQSTAGVGSEFYIVLPLEGPPTRH